MIDDLWYKDGIIYCLSVGTYMDADGDGVGDFKGLLRRFDYLHGLGITAIWLMPFQPSPGKDDGYDISDYYGVDPRYGTLGDFVEFSHSCADKRGRHNLLMEGYGYRWYRIGGLDYLLKRSDIDESTTGGGRRSD